MTIWQCDTVTPWHCDNVTRPHLSVGQVSMKKAAYPCPAKQGNTTRTPSAPVISSVMLFILIQTNKVCSGLCLHCCVWQQNHLPAPSWPTRPRGAFQLELNLQLIKYTDMSLFFQWWWESNYWSAVAKAIFRVKKGFLRCSATKANKCSKNCSLKCVRYSKQLFSKVCMLLKTF